MSRVRFPQPDMLESWIDIVSGLCARYDQLSPGAQAKLEQLVYECGFTLPLGKLTTFTHIRLQDLQRIH